MPGKKHLITIEEEVDEDLTKIAKKYYKARISDTINVAIIVLRDYIKSVGTAPHFSEGGELTYPSYLSKKK